MTDEEAKMIVVCNAPRHTLKDFYEQLGKMLDRYPDLADSIILEAEVDTDRESIYEGAVDLELFRTDIQESGTLTIPVIKGAIRCS